MNTVTNYLITGIVIGIAGSTLMDLWGSFLRRVYRVPTLDYALLGRWLGHMPRGRFAHRRIADAPPVRWERPFGWATHYAIGVVFGLLLLGMGGPEWAYSPTLAPAITVGLLTLAAPWFVMQPAMGAGIAGARTPSPWATRARNVATHTVYGIGAYAAAIALAALKWLPTS